MIVSYEHTFIFIKTRKTAGSSIELFLREYLGPLDKVTGSIYDGVDDINVPNGTRGHMGFKEICNFVGERTYDMFWKFTFERNPWDKAVSDYLFKTRVGLIDSKTTFSEYLKTVDSLSDWSRYSQGGIPICDVFHYEKLEKEMESVCKKIGIPAAFDVNKFMAKKSPNRQHYSAYYKNDEDKERVADAFKREIDFFNYGFEDDRN